MSSTLSVEDLQISFGQKEVVHNVTFHLNKGKTLAIVGESGSGKSVTSLAIMGLLNANIKAKTFKFGSTDLLKLSDEEHRAIRGAQMAMIFQEPMTALNPSMRCGDQVAEMIKKHEKVSNQEAKKRVISLFKEVQIPSPEEKYAAWPHELSGGQRQRVVIAMALACSPQLLIADEPTTALDVTVQKEILKLIRELQERREMSVLFITHDLGVVAEVADEVLVLFRGEMMEYGPAEKVLNRPESEYTKGLLACRPPLDDKPYRLTTVEDVMSGRKGTTKKLEKNTSEEVLLEIMDLEKWFTLKNSSWFGSASVFKAVDGVSVKLYKGETLGLVGESGCGKSTLSRCLVHLHETNAGSIKWKGRDITHLHGSALRKIRKEIQMIFQDPFASLNPRSKVIDVLTEPMIVHKLHKGKRKERAAYLLERVGLSKDDLHKYPHEFSGGQRQRIGVARALAVEPELLICDESVSALDVSVQAQVLNLLNELKEEFGFSYLFISHDLSVVKYMSDHLMVMRSGLLEEYGDSEEVYHRPSSDYTKKLIASIPKV